MTCDCDTLFIPPNSIYALDDIKSASFTLIFILDELFTEDEPITKFSMLTFSPGEIGLLLRSVSYTHLTLPTNREV